MTTRSAVARRMHGPAGAGLPLWFPLVVWLAVCFAGCAGEGEELPDAGPPFDAVAAPDDGGGRLSEGAVGDAAAGAEDAPAAAPDGGPAAGPDGTALSDDVGLQGAATEHQASYLELLWEGDVDTAPAGLSDAFSFETPADAVSVAVEVEGQPGALYVASYLERAGAAKPDVPNLWMFQLGNPGVCKTCRVRVSPTEQVYTLFFPNTPVYPYVPGAWTMKVYGMNVTGKALSWKPVHVRVYAKHAGPPPGPGALRLHFHFTGAGGLTASNAPTSKHFQAALDGTRKFLAQAGIEIAGVTYQDAPPMYAVVDSFLGPDSDLTRLFGLAQGQGPDGIHVYVVQSLADASLQQGFALVEGVTSGIPGAVRGDTARAGIAVTYSGMLFAGAPGLVLAHEIGHYLGLYHATEQDGSGDNIPDTHTGDPTNIMHWSAMYPHASFSPGQSVVMERHPLVAPPGAEDTPVP